jgi:hypothetical protein
VGSAGGIVTLAVVHTAPVALSDGRETGRIVSAGKATPHERKDYTAQPLAATKREYGVPFSR